MRIENADTVSIIDRDGYTDCDKAIYKISHDALSALTSVLYPVDISYIGNIETCCTALRNLQKAVIARAVSFS